MLYQAVYFYNPCAASLVQELLDYCDEYEDSGSSSNSIATMKWIIETMLALGTGNEYYYREEHNH